MTERVATPDELARQAYAAAIRLLARRDHSIAELTSKLSLRDHQPESIDAAIQELQAANYVNDTRYAELYAEQRMNRGYGPLSIQSKLTQRGIDSHLIQHALAHLEAEWSEHAAAVILKRFSTAVLSDLDQRGTAKIARFLQARGFASSDAFRALQSARRQLKE